MRQSISVAHKLIFPLLALVLYGSCSRHLAAEPQLFTVSNELSSFNVSGRYRPIPTDLSEQKPGSLSGKLEGTVEVNRTGGMLSFDGTSAIDLALHPAAPFQPVSPGEDNFGGLLNVVESGFPVATVNAAARDVFISLSGDAAVQSPAASLVFEFTGGRIDYHVDSILGADEMGSYLLTDADSASNDSAANVGLAVEDGSELLAIPFDITVLASIAAPDDFELRLFGMIVGTRPILPGDYNADGSVDAIDYAVWRNNLGADAGALSNDADGGQIGTAQYQTWRVNYGKSASRASFYSPSTPEPGTIQSLLTLFCILAMLERGRTHRTSHHPIENVSS